jgi:hypothetical protein
MMWLDYSTPGVLKLYMTYYVKAIIDNFPDKLEGTGKYPWTDNLFVIDPKSKSLEDKRKTIFHTFVRKGEQGEISSQLLRFCLRRQLNQTKTIGKS